MGHRLIVLLAMGLGALYMLHLLAQDWNSIQRPTSAAIRGILTEASNNLNSYLIRDKRNTNNSFKLDNFTNSYVNRNKNLTRLFIDWKRILSHDPFQCLQSMICQLTSGAKSDSIDARFLYEFLAANIYTSPSTIQLAFSRGLDLSNSNSYTYNCFDEYPLCLYSVKTMLRILKWFEKIDNIHIKTIL